MEISGFDIVGNMEKMDCYDDVTTPYHFCFINWALWDEDLWAKFWGLDCGGIIFVS